jgi:hypothetical protein
VLPPLAAWIPFDSSPDVELIPALFVLFDALVVDAPFLL